MFELMLMLLVAIVVVIVAIVGSIYMFINMLVWDHRFADVDRLGRNSKYAYLFRDEYLDLVEGKN